MLLLAVEDDLIPVGSHRPEGRVRRDQPVPEERGRLSRLLECGCALVERALAHLEGERHESEVAPRGLEETGAPLGRLPLVSVPILLNVFRICTRG